MKKELKDLHFFINSGLAARELNFLTNPTDILKALIQSKEEGSSIGIRSDKFEEGTIVTGVEDVLIDADDTMVVLKPYDSTGYILPVNKINLTEIQAAYPFSTPFVNPFINKIEKEKTWFF